MSQQRVKHEARKVLEQLRGGSMQPKESLDDYIRSVAERVEVLIETNFEDEPTQCEEYLVGILILMNLIPDDVNTEDFEQAMETYNTLSIVEVMDG